MTMRFWPSWCRFLILDPLDLPDRSLDVTSAVTPCHVPQTVTSDVPLTLTCYSSSTNDLPKMNLFTVYPIWGDIFEKLFQSSKFKARTSLFTQTWQKRRSSVELWVLEQHSKMSTQALCARVFVELKSFFFALIQLRFVYYKRSGACLIEIWKLRVRVDLFRGQIRWHFVFDWYWLYYFMRAFVSNKKPTSIPEPSNQVSAYGFCNTLFRLKPENINSDGFELHRLSIKGTKLLLKEIKAIVIIEHNVHV